MLVGWVIRASAEGKMVSWNFEAENGRGEESGGLRAKGEQSEAKRTVFCRFKTEGWNG